MTALPNLPDRVLIGASTTCGICNCDAAIYRTSDSRGPAVCRRPACEFEALYLYPEARLTPINPALEELL